MFALKASTVFFLVGLMFAWGQTSPTNPDPLSVCPSWNYFQSSQEMLANMTMQLGDMVTKHSTSSESLTSISNLLQLVLGNCKQLLAELHRAYDNTPANVCTTRQAIQNLTAIVQKLSQSISDGSCSPSSLQSSCEEIKRKWPGSLSGYYTIVDSKGHARHVYCQMEQVCGSSGWMRVAYLNMSEPGEECPSGFRLYNEIGIRACGRQASGGRCQSVQFPTYNIYILF